MSASITTKKGTIAGQYLRRTAGIIKGATGEYFSEALPVTIPAIREAASAINSTSQTLANTTKSVMPKIRQLRSQVTFKNFNNWFLRKEEEYSDSSFDYDIPFDTDVEGDNGAAIAEYEVNENSRHANQISRAVVESSHQMVESQLLSTANIATTLDKQTAVISAGFDTTNQTLNKILEVLTKNTATLIETTVARDAERNTNNDLIVSGKFNARKYRKMVSQNIANSPIGALSAISSMAGMLNGELITPELVFGELFKWGVNKRAPNLKRNLRSLDDAVNSAIMTSLIRLGDNAGWDTKGQFANIFGLKAGRRNVVTSRSDLELKSISYDTMSKEAITNTIPGYLRQILIQLGGPDMVYNYKGRSFKKSSNVEKKFREATTNVDTFFNAKSTIQDGLAWTNNGVLLYDLMMNDLGSSYASSKDKRDQLDRMAGNRKATAQYIQKLTKGMKFSEKDIAEQEQFIDLLAKLLSDGKNRADISIQAAGNEITRQEKGNAFVRDSIKYNIDLSDLRDNNEAARRYIASAYGVNMEDDDSTSTIRGVLSNAPKGQQGFSYANKALYEIYQRLDRGLNVFVLGSDNIPMRRFTRLKGLKPPMFYHSKSDSVKDGGATVKTITHPASLDPNKYNDDPNLLENQTDAEGNTENLKTGERIGRWGKKRGHQLIGALFNGSANDVKQIFSASMADIAEVSGEKMKEGMQKIDRSFGNVSGYLKHKMFGSEYSYETGEIGPDKKPIVKVVKENKNGGIFGFINTEIKGMFKGATDKASDWFKEVASYFDHDEKDPDDPNGDVKKRRKKLIATSVGAFAGAGLFGAPLAVLVGGLAGNALSTLNIGDKLKKTLFGVDKDGNPTGVLAKAADKIISPIQFLMDKTLNSASNFLKKNILGPLSDLGRSISDRIHNHVDGAIRRFVINPLKDAGGFIAGKIKDFGSGLFKGAKTVVSFPFKMLGKGFKAATEAVSSIAKNASNSISDSIIGKTAKSIAGGISTGFNMIRSGIIKLGGSEFHKLRKGERYDLHIGDTYIIPGEDPPKIHSLKADDPNIVDLENGSRGVILVGDGKTTWMPRTKDYNRYRKRERNRKIKEESVGSFKSWRLKRDEARKGRFNRFKDAISEEEMSPAEIQAREDAKRTADATEGIKENTDATLSAVEEINEASKGPDCIFTHDQGIRDRLDIIIERIGGGTQPGSINNQSPVKSNQPNGNKEPDPVSLAMLQGAATLADEGGLDERDEKNLERMARGVSRGESRQTLFTRFKSVMRENRDKADAAAVKEEKKEESFLSKLVSGLGNVLANNWPILLGGLAFLSKEFRNLIMNEAIPAITEWAAKNLPNIFKGVEDVVEDINEIIEDQATGAVFTRDPVTNEGKGVTTAESHAQTVANGEISTAWSTTMNPFRLGKDMLIMSGERAAIRGLSTGAQVLSGGLGLGGIIANTGAKGFQMGSAFLQGVKSGGLSKAGLSKGWDWALRAKALGGSAKAQAMKDAGVAGIKGFGDIKATFGKITDPRTWLNPTAIANMAGGAASDILATVGWESMENLKNANIVGDYGFGRAGGFVRTSSKAKSATTTTIGIVGGIAISKAVAVATGAVSTFAVANGWNPVGWAAAVIAGVLAAAAALGAISNALIGAIGAAMDRGYAIRSNAAKLKAVINGDASYDNGSDNPMYVYCGQESDRVIGLTKGLNVKDPDLMIGQYMRMLADNLTSMPGSEVLFYDLINNMAVQGVPFAVDMVGKSSDEANQGGDQANKNSCGDPPAQSNPLIGFKKTWVSYDQVKEYTESIYADIATNVGRQDSACVWTRDNLKYVYDLGENVFNKLKGKGVIQDGKVQTKKFKNHPGDTSNADGWKALDELCRSEGSYFLTQCLVYINSKIECTKEGKQWVEDRVDDIKGLMDGLEDFFRKESNAKIQALKDQGLSDKEIEEEIKRQVNPKGESATGAAGLAQPESAILSDVNKNKIKNSDKAEVTKELKYVSAAYAYSHPTFLQEWVEKHQKESGVSIDYVKEIPNWKTFGDTRKRSTLRSQMMSAALKFAESAGDIYDLTNKFDWSESGKIYGSDPEKRYQIHGDAGFTIRGGAKKGESILDKIFESANPSEFTPEDVHKKLFGKVDHGKASEADTTSGQDWTLSGSGQLAAIADMIAKYPSDEGVNLVSGNHIDKWRNALINMPASSPPNLPTGGPITPEDLDIEPENTEGATINQDGGNPLNKPLNTPRNGQKYGMRTLNKGPEFHSGVDLTPADNSGSAQVGARFNGTISKVKWDVPDSHTGLGVSSDQCGNYVEFKTDDGKTIKNYHLKANSIPAKFRQVGTRVNIGDKIGEMGSTGRSTGAHLHYQIESPEYPANPKGLHTVDPMTTINGSSSQSSTFNTSDDSSSLTRYFSSDSSSDGSTTDSSSSKTGLAGVLAALSDAGKQILNKITGGLFGDTSSSSDGSSIGDSSFFSNGSFNNSGAVSLNSGTVTSLAEFLALCAAEIGYTESPPNSNKTKYGEWYGMNGQPWCMIFVQWCFNQAGLTLPHKTASCKDMLSWYKRNRSNLVHNAGQPGDIAIFSAGHTGIVETVNGTNYTCIEGNTSATDRGSQTNGGCVARKNRKASQINAFITAVDFGQLERMSSEISGTVGAGAEGIWKFLKQAGYSDEGAAGIMGNLDAESGLQPNNLQNSYNTKFGMTDEQYTAAVDNGSYSNFVRDSGGYGLAQWTYWSRKQKLLDDAKKAGKSIADPSVQMNRLVKEIAEYGLDSRLKKASSVKAASNIMLHDFESPADQSAAVENKRASMGQKFYDKFRGTGNDESIGGPDAEISNDQSLKRFDPETLPDDGTPIGGPSSTIRTPHVRRSQPIQPKKGKSNSALGGPLAAVSHGEGEDTSTYAIKGLKKLSSQASTSTNVPTLSSNNLDPAIAVMQQMLDALISIRDNTGSSNDLLSSLNEKDFVDKGVRDSLKALGKVPKRNNRPISSGNASQIVSMARP